MKLPSWPTPAKYFSLVDNIRRRFFILAIFSFHYSTSSQCGEKGGTIVGKAWSWQQWHLARNSWLMSTGPVLISLSTTLVQYHITDHWSVLMTTGPVLISPSTPTHQSQITDSLISTGVRIYNNCGTVLPHCSIVPKILVHLLRKTFECFNFEIEKMEGEKTMAD